MNSPETKPLSLAYEERNALHVLRKAIKLKPEIIKLLMKDASYEMAMTVLKQTSNELKQMLEVTQAFAKAAEVLTKQKKELK